MLQAMYSLHSILNSCFALYLCYNFCSVVKPLLRAEDRMIESICSNCFLNICVLGPVDYLVAEKIVKILWTCFKMLFSHLMTSCSWMEARMFPEEGFNPMASLLSNWLGGTCGLTGNIFFHGDITCIPRCIIHSH